LTPIHEEKISMKRYLKLLVLAALVVLIPIIAVAASNSSARPVEAAPLANGDGESPEHPEPSDELWFARYDGIAGESDGPPLPPTGEDGPKAHGESGGEWIDILSISWGSHKPGGGATGQSRRRGGVVVEDLIITMEYEKSTVKLLEKLNLGEVIPKVEIEQTANYGGSRATYIKYELTNVQVTSFQVSGDTSEGGPPTVTIANNFEEYKVTYTEYDSEGDKGGDVETTWKVEKGER
jgi:type VI protein secretion system component Hcp